MMEVVYSTQSTQTLVPIVIDVAKTATAPEFWVEPKETEHQIESFTLPVYKTNDGYQARFWLEQPGEYWVHVQAGAEHKVELLNIRSHIFLPFSSEFGIFIPTLIVAFLGVYLWHKKKIKQTKTSA